MRKRRYGLQTAILGAAVLMMLTGCGKKEQSEKDQALEYYQNELELDAKDAQDLADAIYGDGSTAGQKTEETQDVDYKHFDADPGWKDVTPDECAIQIDDVLYVMGESAADFIKQVDGSSVEYTYDYNPDRLVEPNSSEEIKVYRDGREWLRAWATNVTKETTSLSECPIYGVRYADKYADNYGDKYADDVVKPYCYFIDGRSYEDILAMNYADVNALEDGIFSDYWYKVESKASPVGYDKEVIQIEYRAKQNTILERAKYTDYAVMVYGYYRFYIDKDTSKVVGFNMADLPTAFNELYVPTPITQFSEMTQEEQNQLMQAAIEEQKKQNGYTNVEFVAACLQGNHTVRYRDQGVDLDADNLVIVFKVIKSDGTEGYIPSELYNVARTVNGKLHYDRIFTGSWEYDSVDEIVKSCEFEKDNTSDTLWAS